MMGYRYRSIALALVSFLGACGGENGTSPTDAALDAPGACSPAQLASLEQQLATALDAAAQDPSITSEPDVTLLLESENGHGFAHSHGSSSASSSYESASTSKLVSAVVILDLVEQGVLSLESKPHDLISWWTGESAMTLRDLLSFRSGFNDEPLCINVGGASYETCVQSIYDGNLAANIAPGTQFYYASTHLQIAGLMAMTATGKTWSQIFAAWQAKTGLFPTGVYDLPSSTNPRLAGGMHWTGEEYLALLRGLYHGTLLTPALRTELFANQRDSATVENSPLISAYNEDWAYGLGNWLECPAAIGPNTFDCGSGHRNSSPGAYGAYPFLDFDHDYIGMLARQGDLGTFREGLAVFRAVEAVATQWADCARAQP
jgi:CubicO group peptidase (beta-lactamase class C family)